jgi:hypothetical protein
MIKLAILPFARVPTLSLTPSISAGMVVKAFKACFSVSP